MSFGSKAGEIILWLSGTNLETLFSLPCVTSGLCWSRARYMLRTIVGNDVQTTVQFLVKILSVYLTSYSQL